MVRYVLFFAAHSSQLTDLLAPSPKNIPMFPELAQELADLEAQALRRRLQVVEEVLPGGKVRVGGQVLLNLSSNDYLGLAQDPRLIAGAQAAAARWGVGAGASRLVVGHLALHEEVETELAGFKGTEAAVVFSTGYMANLGVIAALLGPGDLIFSDRLNHASIMEGIKLSGAALQRFPHRDLKGLEKALQKTPGGKRRLIITDSVFSVDGDLAPLRELVELKERYGAWLMIDEAHATGVLGPSGAGLAQELRLTDAVEIHMGTFSKALGSLGGYVAGARRLIDYLHNRARSFIYSTALPPPILGAIQAALQIVREEPERRAGLLQKSENFRHGLQTAGFDTLGSETQIVPVLVGKNEPTLKFAAALRQRGLMAVGLRPPTVPPGKARVRFSLSAAHGAEDLARALETIVETGREMGLAR
jgi:8-amino-7-oxononanoate synthase